MEKPTRFRLSAEAILAVIIAILTLVGVILSTRSGSGPGTSTRHQSSERRTILLPMGRYGFFPIPNRNR